MGGDRNRGVDAERDRRQHRRADNRAVDEIVEPVADQDERRGRRVHFAVIGVAMSQQHQLFENEEQHDAAEQRAEHRCRRQHAERFGQQRQQRDAEQRPDGIADQPGHDPLPHRVGEEHERRCDEQAAAAADEAEAERGGERMHAPF